MIDPGNEQRTSEGSVGPLTLLGTGGQGRVYALTDRPSTAYKKYADQVRDEVDGAVLASMTAFPGALSAADAAPLIERAAWPTTIVESHGLTAGFLMPRVPSAFSVAMRLPSGVKETLAKMQLLLNDAGYLTRCGLTVDDRFRLELLRDTAETLELFHRLGIAVGDFSPNNICFSLARRPRCYFIDCDAMRLRGRTVLPQVETNDWEVPGPEQRATAESDSYKFALLCIRLFAGDQSTRDASELRRAGSAVHTLAVRGLSTDARRRPPAVDWRIALAAAARSGPGTKPHRPAPSRPTPDRPRTTSRPPMTTPRRSLARRAARAAGHAAARRIRRTRPAGFVKFTLLTVLLLYAVPHLGSCRAWWQAAVTAATSDTGTANIAEQASGMAQLLADSGADRKQVVTAVQDVIACRRLSRAQSALSEAAAGRRVSRERAAALRTEKLPDGAELKSQLVSALTHSAAADDAYGRWAEAVQRSGCRSAVMRGPDRARGDSESRAATAAKKRVAALWNPIAGRYGKPSVTFTGI